MKPHVWIIWWWAAWLMAAATLLERDDRDGHISLFEKNSLLGAKVIISWWWRCNLTTWYVRTKDLEPAYTRWRDFFSWFLKRFTPRSVRKRFESHWIPCKEEDDKRIFPVSNNWKEVTRMFTDFFKKHTDRITIKYKTPVIDISKTSTWFKVTAQDGEIHRFDKILLCTWWQAFKHTWSSWDGYSFAQSLWHTITQLWPSLNSFRIQEKRAKELSWLVLKWAAISFSKDPTSLKREWDLLLTHFWISGPLAFIAASHLAFHEITPNSPLILHIHPIADMSEQDRNTFLLDSSKKYPKKELQTILSSVLPKRFCESFLWEFDIMIHQKIWSLSKRDRLLVSRLLWQGIPLTLLQRRPWDEFVTAWWVSTQEIDHLTLESKVTPWCYFAWEILNIDWITWWYNLQMCRATWRAAAFHI